MQAAHSDLAAGADAPGVLDYGPRSPVRWRRRLRWTGVIGLLLALAGLGVGYGPRVWRHLQLMRVQEACMDAELPLDRPMWETDRAAASALVAARRWEYELDFHDGAARCDPRWAKLVAELAPASKYPMTGGPFGTTFCHERFTPDGRRRLIVGEGLWKVTVIQPAEWFSGRAPRVLGRGDAEFDDATRDGLIATAGLSGSFRIGAGLPDPADRSRWTVPFVQGGVAGTWEFRLGNEDRVTMRLLDPDGFMKRAETAQLAAATRPATAPRRGAGL